jgi:hypothetical protein
MHECLVIKMVFKQHVLDNAEGAFSQPLLLGLFGAELLTIMSLSLAQFLNSVLKQGPLSHLISPGLPSKKNIFSMCPMIDSAVCELSLATSGNPEYLSTTIRKLCFPSSEEVCSDLCHWVQILEGSLLDLFLFLL